MRSSTDKGFTLIEVVIATFIVSVALIALAGTIQALSKQTSRIEEIFIANLIASNTMAELQLQPEWPEIGEKKDTVEMAMRDWFYEVKVEATEVETLRRVEVSVGLDDERENVSSLLIGFVSSSPQIGQRPVDWLQQNKNTNEEETPEDLTDPGRLTGGRQ